MIDHNLQQAKAQALRAFLVGELREAANAGQSYADSH
jgi:hypothetical protein